MASEIRPAVARALSPEEIKAKTESAAQSGATIGDRAKQPESQSNTLSLDTVRLSAARVLAHQTLPEDESAESAGSDALADESDLSIIA